MRVAVGSDEKTGLTDVVVEDLILEASFSTAYPPNPDDASCMAELDALENEYRE
jgi:hypothetical protein